MTSIIMCAFDNFKWQRHITFAALNCIRRFTDKGLYELILVDTGTMCGYTGGPYNRWEIIKPDKHLKTGDIGYSAAMNLGVKNAVKNSEYYVFMHNDVFVQGGWLPVLTDYVRAGTYDYAYPDQIARTRENMEEIYKANINREEVEGYDEAGLIMMTKDAYQRLGGWDEDFKSVYQDLALHRRARAAGLRLYCTTRTFITHIGTVGYAHDDSIEEKIRGHESELIKEKYG